MPKSYRKLQTPIYGFLNEICGYLSAEIALKSSHSLKGEAEVHRLGQKDHRA